MRGCNFGAIHPQKPAIRSSFVTLPTSYTEMKTVNERSQFDAVQQHLQTIRNYLHTVISPNDILLRNAMQDYALTLKRDLRTAA